jgi:hypothetical protein
MSKMQEDEVHQAEKTRRPGEDEVFLLRPVFQGL